MFKTQTIWSSSILILFLGLISCSKEQEKTTDTWTSPNIELITPDGKVQLLSDMGANAVPSSSRIRFNDRSMISTEIRSTCQVGGVDNSVDTEDIQLGVTTELEIQAIMPILSLRRSSNDFNCQFSIVLKNGVGSTRSYTVQNLLIKRVSHTRSAKFKYQNSNLDESDFVYREDLNKVRLEIPEVVLNSISNGDVELVCEAYRATEKNVNLQRLNFKKIVDSKFHEYEQSSRKHRLQSCLVRIYLHDGSYYFSSNLIRIGFKRSPSVRLTYSPAPREHGDPNGQSELRIGSYVIKNNGTEKTTVMVPAGLGSLEVQDTPRGGPGFHANFPAPGPNQYRYEITGAHRLNGHYILNLDAGEGAVINVYGRFSWECRYSEHNEMIAVRFRPISDLIFYHAGQVYDFDGAEEPQPYESIGIDSFTQIRSQQKWYHLYLWGLDYWTWTGNDPDGKEILPAPQNCRGS